MPKYLNAFDMGGSDDASPFVDVGHDASFELVACVDGRGFGVRRQDMRDMLTAAKGKVFTLSTLDQLIQHTRLSEFLPRNRRP